MRKLLRQMAKAKMERMGVSKINKRMSHGRWRDIIGAYPINTITGEKMKKGYVGKKRYDKYHCGPQPLFKYTRRVKRA